MPDSKSFNAKIENVIANIIPIPKIIFFIMFFLFRHITLVIKN